MEPARACLLDGRGRPGEEDSGSKGGSSDGAGRLMPAAIVVGSRGGSEALLPSEESIMAGVCSSHENVKIE